MNKRFVQLLALSCLIAINLISLPGFAPAKTSPANSASKTKPAAKSDASCSTCTGCSADSGQKLANRLATLGRQSQNNSLLVIKRASGKGFPIEFVSSSTGELAFAVTDLAFQDNPLLLFQRTYVSSRNEDFGLGRGWSFAYNDKIVLHAGGGVLTTSTGDNFVYRQTDARRFILQTPDSVDVKEFSVENGDVITAANGDATKIYERFGNEYYLSRIVAGGFEVAVNRERNGQIRGISSASGEINFVWSNGGGSAKLLAVADSVARQISFGQTNDLLQNAASATGGAWRYEYADGKLTLALDPADRIALGARYDANGRTIEFGDAANANRLSYEITNNSTRTIVADALNYVRIFQHDERGMITQVSDAGGVLTSVRRDAEGRPVQVTDASGASQIFNYDAQGRLTRQQMPDGGEKIFEYFPDGRLAVVTENGQRREFSYDGNRSLTESRAQIRGKNVRTNFDQRGRMIRHAVENGLTTSFEYDVKGRETAFVYSDIGRFEKAFDAAGRKTSEKLPSGLTYFYEYDANNKLTRKSDNRGNGFRAEYDASGALARLVKNDGSWSQVVRDQAGRIIELRNSRGKSRRYSYNARGSLIEYVGADGRHFQFQYDARGTLQNVIKLQNVNSVRRRNQPENVFSLLNASPKSFLQIQNIGYKSAVSKDILSLSDSSSTGLTDDCLFGNDGFSFEYPSSTDLVYTFEPSIDPFNPCNDPFAGMYGFENSGFGSEQGETCEQCRARQGRVCVWSLLACLGLRTVTSVGVFLACEGVTVTIGTLGCIALALGIDMIGTGICGFQFMACHESILDRCPQCNS